MNHGWLILCCLLLLVIAEEALKHCYTQLKFVHLGCVWCCRVFNWTPCLHLGILYWLLLLGSRHMYLYYIQDEFSWEGVQVCILMGQKYPWSPKSHPGGMNLTWWTPFSSDKCLYWKFTINFNLAWRFTLALLAYQWHVCIYMCSVDKYLQHVWCQ